MKIPNREDTFVCRPFRACLFNFLFVTQGVANFVSLALGYYQVAPTALQNP